MQITGTITKATPQGDPYGQYNTRYAFSGLMDAHGVEHNLVWVNRDPRPFDNQKVTITDTSEKQEKIKYEKDKNGQMRYRIMGTGVIIVNDQGTDFAQLATPVYPHQQGNVPPRQQAPAPHQQGATPPHQQGQQAPPHQQAPHQQAAQQKSMKELIDYGLACVGYARGQGEQDGAVLASIFGSAMYGFKEGRQLGLPPRDLAASAKETLDATDDDDLETIPF